MSIVAACFATALVSLGTVTMAIGDADQFDPVTQRTQRVSVTTFRIIVNYY